MFASILRVGNQGPDVVEMQQALNTIGFVNPIDGYYGWSTWSAVKRFQQSQNLLATGVFDISTSRSLENLLSPPVVVGPTRVTAESRLSVGTPLQKPVGVKGGFQFGAAARYKK